MELTYKQALALVVNRQSQHDLTDALNEYLNRGDGEIKNVAGENFEAWASGWIHSAEEPDEEFVVDFAGYLISDTPLTDAEEELVESN